MNSSSLVKVVAAFVTGILVALGGTLLYVKATDGTPSQPIATSPSAPAVQQEAPPAPPSASPAPSTAEAVSEPEPSAPPAPSQHLAHHRSQLAGVGHKFSHNGVPSKQNNTMEVAQVAPAPAPNPYTTAAPSSSPTTSVSALQRAPSRPAVQEPTSIAAPPPPPAREPQSVTLDAGSSIVIRTGQAISSDRSQSGDSFRGTLEIPIIRNGFIIADKGSLVRGRIVTAQQAGRVQGISQLTLALTEINTTDGQRVAIQTASYEKQGANGRRGDAAKIGGGAVLGAIIGAIAGGGKGAAIGAGVGSAAGTGDVLLTRGKATVIPAEAQLTFRLAAPVTITEKLN